MYPIIIYLPVELLGFVKYTWFFDNIWVHIFAYLLFSISAFTRIMLKKCHVNLPSVLS